jgi:hypothetical protein
MHGMNLKEVIAEIGDLEPIINEVAEKWSESYRISMLFKKPPESKEAFVLALKDLLMRIGNEKEERDYQAAYEKAVAEGRIPRISKEEQARREESGMCNDV